MEYGEFIDEVGRRAGPISLDAAEAVVAAYLETLRERLPGDTTEILAAHMPDELAGHIEGQGEGEEFSVWVSYERFAQRAGIAPETTARYARYVGA